MSTDPTAPLTIEVPLEAVLDVLYAMQTAQAAFHAEDVRNAAKNMALGEVRLSPLTQLLGAVGNKLASFVPDPDAEEAPEAADSEGLVVPEGATAKLVGINGEVLA